MQVTFAGTDATSGLLGCTSATYGGPDGDPATVAGTCTDVAGNVSAASVFPLRYDATAPALAPPAARGGDRVVRLRWHRPADAVSLAIVRTPGRHGAASTVVGRGGGSRLLDRQVRNGRRYRYTLRATDAAGNTAQTSVSARPGLRLLGPANGAQLTAPPRLSWTGVRGARYYNVQLFRDGHKVLSAWPRRAHLSLRRSWRFAGHRHRLRRARTLVRLARSRTPVRAPLRRTDRPRPLHDRPLDSPPWRRRRGPSRASGATSFTTLSGEPIRPLYTEADLPDPRSRSGCRASSRSRAACTRRCTAGRLWTMRQFAGFGTAEETNERFRYLLDHGQTGLSTAFDMPSLMGHDSDHAALARRGRPRGRGGRHARRHGDAVRRHRPRRGHGVDDDQRAGGDHARLLRRRRRASTASRADRLGGTIQADILKEYIAQKEWCFPVDPAMRLLGDMIEWCTRHDAALAPGLDLRLPHPRGRLDRRAGARLHAQGRPHLRRAGRSRAGSTSTTSRRG